MTHHPAGPTRPDVDAAAPGGQQRTGWRRDAVIYATGAGAGEGGDGAAAERGLRRARAAALLTLALPGSAYVYQGEELGLPEVTDIPGALRQDPSFFRENGQDGLRDGCRVPIPWSGTEAPYGFGPGSSWLPQPGSWAELSVETQSGDADSTLELYRRAIALRREHAALDAGDSVEGLDAPDGVLAFRREARGGDRTGGDWQGGLVCTVNTTGAAVRVPAPGRALLTSVRVTTEGAEDLLPADSAVWWAV